MKILFCDNEFDNWEESRGIREQYTGRPLECLAKYSPDFLGLKSWFDLENEIPFDSYDIIWIYMGHRLMLPAWYTFPRFIRRKTSKAKIIITTDYEGLWYNQDFDLRIKQAWDEADYMHVITRLGEKIFSNILNIPVYYGTFGRPYAGGIKGIPVPLDIGKRNGVSFIRHTNIPPIITQMEVIKRVGMKAIAFDSVPPPFSDGSDIRMLAKGFGVEGEFHQRLEFEDYLSILNKSYVGLDNHVGPSRFSYEMAMMKIPVVHSENSEYANIIFPDLACPQDGTEEMIAKIKELMGNVDYCVEIGEKGFNTANTYFNPEECQKRLDEFIEIVMKR